MEDLQLKKQAGSADVAQAELFEDLSEAFEAIDFHRLYNQHIAAVQRDELPRFVHFLYCTKSDVERCGEHEHIGMFGTLTYSDDGYVGEFTKNYRTQRRDLPEDIVPVVLSTASMRQYLNMLFNKTLTNAPVPPENWNKINTLRCFAISTPLNHAPGLFEFRSIWDTISNAPWDCVHYSGWARDPVYAREHNPVWNVESGADQAFSFLIDTLGIRKHLGTLGFVCELNTG